MPILAVSEPTKPAKAIVDILCVGAKVECYDAGDNAAKWISKYLDTPSRLSINPINRSLRDGDDFDYDRQSLK